MRNVKLLLSFVTLMVSLLCVSSSSAQIIAQSVFILQDLVEDFDHGNNAGGTLTGFGNALGSFELQDSQGIDPAGGAGTNFTAAGFLSTADSGFGTAAAGEDFIGFGKTFDSVIDASSFNSLAARIKSGNANTTTSTAAVVLELTIGDGGNDSSVAGDETGSTWRSPEFLISDLTASADAAENGFAQILAQFVGFNREIGPTVNPGTNQTDLLTLRDMITGVNVLLVSNGEIGTAGDPRAIFVDNLEFFTNDTVLTVVADRSFVPTGSEEMIQITATVLDGDGNAANPAVRLLFTAIDAAGGTLDSTCRDTSLVDGTAVVIFTTDAANVTPVITEITVDEDTTCIPN